MPDTAIVFAADAGQLLTSRRRVTNIYQQELWNRIHKGTLSDAAWKKIIVDQIHNEPSYTMVVIRQYNNKFYAESVIVPILSKWHYAVICTDANSGQELARAYGFSAQWPYVKHDNWPMVFEVNESDVFAYIMHVVSLDENNNMIDTIWRSEELQASFIGSQK